jgi:glycosyltransferase involved in cell wall biosynthesis
VFNPHGDLADFATGDQVPGIPCTFDAAAFAAAFRKLHASPELRDSLGRTAGSRALADFDWSSFVDRLERFYGEAFARGLERARGAATESDSTL